MVPFYFSFLYIILSLSKIIGIHSIHGIHMTTYSEKPLRILGLTVLLSISEHMVHFCPQKVYKRYTSSIHQGRADTSISPRFTQVGRWDLHKYLHKYVGGIYTSLHKYLSPFRLTAASKEREIDAACS